MGFSQQNIKIISLSLLLITCKTSAQQWNAPVSLPQKFTGSIRGYDLAIDSKNHLHIVWDQGRGLTSDSAGIPDEIFYSKYNGSSWSKPINISNTPNPSGSPKIVIDSLDHPHIIWAEDLGPRDTLEPFYKTSDLFYTFYDGKEWLKPVSLYHDSLRRIEASLCSYPYKIGIDSKGHIHICFGFHSVYRLRYMKGDGIHWSSPESLNANYPFDFFIDSSDILHLSYIGAFPPYPANNDVLYRYLDISNGKWSDSIPVHKSDGMDTLSCECRIIVDHNGKIHILWTESWDRNAWGEDILYSSSIDGISWATPQNLTNNDGSVPYLFAPGVTVDDKNIIHIAWAPSKGPVGEKMIYYMYGNGEAWSKWDTVHSPAHVQLQPAPLLVVDKTNKLHLVWIGQFPYTLNDSIYYATKSVAGISFEESAVIHLQLLEISSNPFQAVVHIRCQLTSKGPISLKVYDIQGRLVRTLIRAKNQELGAYTIKWDGRDDKGKILPLGVYFVKLEAKGINQIKKVILMR